MGLPGAFDSEVSGTFQSLLITKGCKKFKFISDQKHEFWAITSWENLNPAYETVGLSIYDLSCYGSSPLRRDFLPPRPFLSSIDVLNLRWLGIWCFFFLFSSKAFLEMYQTGAGNAVILFPLWNLHDFLVYVLGRSCHRGWVAW